MSSDEENQQQQQPPAAKRTAKPRVRTTQGAIALQRIQGSRDLSPLLREQVLPDMLAVRLAPKTRLVPVEVRALDPSRVRSFPPGALKPGTDPILFCRDELKLPTFQRSKSSHKARERIEADLAKALPLCLLTGTVTSAASGYSVYGYSTAPADSDLATKLAPAYFMPVAVEYLEKFHLPAYRYDQLAENALATMTVDQQRHGAVLVPALPPFAPFDPRYYVFKFAQATKNADAATAGDGDAEEEDEEEEQTAKKKVVDAGAAGAAGAAGKSKSKGHHHHPMAAPASAAYDGFRQRAHQWLLRQVRVGGKRPSGLLFDPAQWAALGIPPLTTESTRNFLSFPPGLVTGFDFARLEQTLSQGAGANDAGAWPCRTLAELYLITANGIGATTQVLFKDGDPTFKEKFDAATLHQHTHLFELSEEGKRALAIVGAIRAVGLATTRMLAAESAGLFTTRSNDFLAFALCVERVPNILACQLPERYMGPPLRCALTGRPLAAGERITVFQGYLRPAFAIDATRREVMCCIGDTCPYATLPLFRAGPAAMAMAGSAAPPAAEVRAKPPPRKRLRKASTPQDKDAMDIDVPASAPAPTPAPTPRKVTTAKTLKFSLGTTERPVTPVPVNEVLVDDGFVELGPRAVFAIDAAALGTVRALLTGAKASGSIAAVEAAAACARAREATDSGAAATTATLTAMSGEQKTDMSPWIALIGALFVNAPPPVVTPAPVPPPPPIKTEEDAFMEMMGLAAFVPEQAPAPPPPPPPHRRRKLAFAGPLAVPFVRVLLQNMGMAEDMAARRGIALPSRMERFKSVMAKSTARDGVHAVLAYLFPQGTKAQ
jgi:hypothetical protein